MKHPLSHLALSSLFLLPAIVSASSETEAIFFAQDAKVSYYSDFENKSLLPQIGAGRWRDKADNATADNFVSVSGSDTALKLSYHGWSTQEQTVLNAGATNWTIAFRSQTGSTDHGLLFSFGSTDDNKIDKVNWGPGLAVRRGTTPGSVEVSLGKNPDAEIKVSGTADATNEDSHAYALTYTSNRLLTLYRDGVVVGTFNNNSDGKEKEAVICTPFQWGERHGKVNMEGETTSVDGTLSYFGVWKRVLTADELKAVDADPAVPQMNGPATWAPPADLTWKMPEMAWKPLPLRGEVPFVLERQIAQKQTIDGRIVLAAQIAAQNGEDTSAHPSVYALHNGGDKEVRTLDRDVCIKLTEGDFGSVIAGGASLWNSGTRFPKGNLYLEVGPQATARETVGVLYKCDEVPTGPIAANAVTVIDGKVTGSAIGGIYAFYGSQESVRGNTGIVVRSLQTGNGPKNTSELGIIGGSCAKHRTEGYTSGVRHTGDTSVRVDLSALPEESGSVFDKVIVGGSYCRTDSGSYKDWSITGSTSVSVTAPADVEFKSPIFGGSQEYNNNGTINASIVGEASVTLNGGTFTGTIVAGGSGKGAILKKREDGTGGTATLTVSGQAVLKGCDLLPFDRGASAEGETVLSFTNGHRLLDLTNVGKIGPFSRLVFPEGRFGLSLGRTRFGDTLLPIRSKDTAVVIRDVAPTPEEIAAGSIEIGRFEGSEEELTQGYSFIVPDEDPKAWKPALTSAGRIVLRRPALEVSWSSEADEAAWTEGLPGFKPYDSAMLQAPRPVTAVIENDLRASDITVGSDFTLSGPGSLRADTVRITETGRLNIHNTRPSVRYIRLNILSRPRKTPTTDPKYPTLADGLALAEIIPMKNGVTVAWPWPAEERSSHIKASQANVNGIASAANLLDGKYTGDDKAGSKWFWGDKDHNTGKCTITLDAGEGRTFDIDAIRLAPADVKGRNPKDWTLDTSSDGSAWTTVYTMEQSDGEAWELSAETVYAIGRQPSVSAERIRVAPGGTLAGSCTADTFRFEEGARLETSPANVPVLRGTLSGTVTPVPPAGTEFSEHCLPLVRCKASSDLVWILPAPYTSAFYRNGAYWATDLKMPLVYSDGALRDANGRTGMSDEELRSLPLKAGDVRIDVRADVTVDTWPANLPLPDLTLIGAEEETATPPVLTFGTEARNALRAKQLIVTGALQCSAFPDGNLSNKAGVLPMVLTEGSALTFGVPKDVKHALPRLSGPGTLRKIGPGTAVIYGDSKNLLADGNPRIELREGELQVNHLTGDAFIGAATFVFSDGNADGKADGTLKSVGGWIRTLRDKSVVFEVADTVTSGAQAFGINISGEGGLVKNGGGLLELSLIDNKSATSSNPAYNRPYSGPTVVNGGTLKIGTASPTVNWYSRFASDTGKGRLVFSGKTEYLLFSNDSTVNADLIVEADTKMVITGNAKNMVIPSGSTLAIRGSYEHTSAGIFRLADGAVFDVAGGRGTIASGRVTVGNVLNIVATQDQVDKGQTLLTGIAAAPKKVTVRDPEGNLLAAGVKLEKGTLSLTAAELPPPEPEIVLPPEAGTLPDTVKDTLTALAEQAGVKEITEIRPAADSVGQMAAEALSVFDGIAALVKGDGETAAVEVTYSFGVSAMKHILIGDTPTLLVAATVQSSAGTADYREGTLLSAQDTDPAARALPPFEAQAPLSDEEITQYFGEKAAGTRYLKLTLRKGSTAELFRVSVRPAR